MARGGSIEFIKEPTDFSGYYNLKYVARSLVYRALKYEEIVLENLKNFMENIELENIEDITDMIMLPKDINKKKFHTKAAINILKEMVEFHIAAAKRTRYEKAAYYCSVIKDLSALLGQTQEFNTYYET